ncbi:2-hydroxymuconate tautomerase family protein [Pseudodesulfovibrio cashew]|uniref:Tautomerase n=1 Tax=Pseudodesulfovibrio cashew TaxID=2678688 RepID=A0A6I6JQL6_9BACT|nr:4-oxalocrotonate tautomerase DmpI [Pseudodesulfovibrio cashew]QGY39954.1 2-hydroxymuconate tautomerase family protein [Pseudodesulfovibrio cashew]
MPILRVETWAGLPKEKKRDFVETLTREATRILGCPPEAVTVIIDEVPKENWGAAGELCSERFPDK